MRHAIPALLLTLSSGLACAATPAKTTTAPKVEVPRIQHPDGETPAWWFRNGAAEAASRGAMQGKAKNVIVFLGDGMSITTVAAARILEGQRKGQSGEENHLSFEDFPGTAFSRTYNTDSQTPDSAGTMSAIATGVKTRIGVLSIGQDAKRGDCAGALKSPTLTLWELAAANGMATGVVTTTRVTHATPAATFSHSADRNWEGDTEMPESAKQAGCIDIARQMVESRYGTGPDVLMGGGREYFMPASQRDPEYDDKVGQRLDDRDLIAEWKSRHPGGSYVWNAKQLADASPNGALLALFEPDHMQYEHDRPKDAAGEPSLAEMTRAAIQRLQKNRTGFVLLVEGGRIDHAHHAGNAYRALTDTIAFSDAVRAASEMTSADDTLIIVTADHAHTMTFAGYPTRGNPILGKVKGGSGEGGDPKEYARDASGLPYTTLGYANGPGNVGATDQQPEGPKHYPHLGSSFQNIENGRPNLTDVNTEDPDYMQEALIPMSAETHGGEDVGVWARGPGATAFRGALEENSLFHVMLQATPRLRAALCTRKDCDAQGIPVELPDPAVFAPTADKR